MKSNVNVKIIDHNIEEFYNILDKINVGVNIIFSNCTFDIKIGNRTIKERKFDTFLYNEDSDILLMLSKDAIISKNDVINYLESKNKSVAEVNFLPITHINETKQKIPNICVCRDEITLEKEIIDSLKKGIKYCKFYPEAISYFMLGYRSNYRLNKIEIDGRTFKGFIKLEDKIILLVNQKYNVDECGKTRNLTKEKVEFILNKYKMNYRISISDDNKTKKEKEQKRLLKQINYVKKSVLN